MAHFAATGGFANSKNYGSGIPAFVLIEQKLGGKYLELFRNYPDVVSVEQLSEMLHIGQVLAYRLVRNGEIKSRKVGREYKIPKVNVIAYLNKEVA